jgi:HAD superfamily hydrolase (TIGR01490 family)
MQVVEHTGPGCRGPAVIDGVLAPAPAALETPPFAFFDVDGTLVRLKTMFSFLDHWFRHSGTMPRLLGPVRAARFDAVRRRYERDGRPREDLNRMFYRTWRGWRPDEVSALVPQWYGEIRRRVPEFYFPRAVEALREHQARGTEIVFVSGSMVEILRPIAAELGVRHLLATRVAVSGGRYTGEIIPPQTIGRGKAQAIRSFLASHDVDGGSCWAYGDDRSDIPMLETVGHAVVCSDAAEMAAVARERGWALDPP